MQAKSSQPRGQEGVMYHGLSKKRYGSDTLITLDSDADPRQGQAKRSPSPPKRNGLPTTPLHVYVKKGDKQEKTRMFKRIPSSPSSFSSFFPFIFFFFELSLNDESFESTLKRKYKGG